MISQQVEEYLESIARLEERGMPVTTSALASERRVSAPSVTEMVHRLSEEGLVSYEARGRVVLTAQGRTMARSVVRRHRLWERFLHDVLRVGWDRVHEEACKLEHATSPEVEQQLARAVGTNATCPHGHTIPTVSGEAISPPTVSLAEVIPPRLVRVVSVNEEDPALLRRFGRLGVRPGAVAEVLSPSPDTGELKLKMGDRSCFLPRDVAREVRIVPIGPEELTPQAVPLNELAAGEAGVVQEVVSGKSFLARCLSLGVIPGTKIVMVQNSGTGPLIARVRRTRVALGRGEAQKIQVLREAQTDVARAATG